MCWDPRRVHIFGITKNGKRLPWHVELKRDHLHSNAGSMKEIGKYFLNRMESKLNNLVKGIESEWSTLFHLLISFFPCWVYFNTILAIESPLD